MYGFSMRNRTTCAWHASCCYLSHIIVSPIAAKLYIWMNHPCFGWWITLLMHDLQQKIEWSLGQLKILKRCRFTCLSWRWFWEIDGDHGHTKCTVDTQPLPIDTVIHLQEVLCQRKLKLKVPYGWRSSWRSKWNTSIIIFEEFLCFFLQIFTQFSRIDTL